MESFTQKLIATGTTTVSTLLLKHYRQVGLTEKELVVFLLIKREQGTVVPLPNIKTLSKQTQMNQRTLFDLFQQMIDKKIMKIVSIIQNGQRVDAYDFQPIYDRLEGIMKNQSDLHTESISVTTNSQPVQQFTRQNLFSAIEQEFGRTLSPIEMETISQWLDIDHYSVELVNLALKEATLSQVYNLKYMDRILINWEKKHLTTPAQIEADKKKHSERYKEMEATNQYTGPEIPFVNLSDQ